jgi:hypothetical protein
VKTGHRLRRAAGIPDKNRLQIVAADRQGVERARRRMRHVGREHPELRGGGRIARGRQQIAGRTRIGAERTGRGAADGEIGAAGKARQQRAEAEPARQILTRTGPLPNTPKPLTRA